MSVCDGVTVTFRDAGHILGSAQVVLDIREGERKFRYLFSGDVGRGGDDILRDPEPVENVDYLQIESTYGGRIHSEKRTATEEVGRLVRGAIERHGKRLCMHGRRIAIEQPSAIEFTQNAHDAAGAMHILDMNVRHRWRDLAQHRDAP